MSLLVTGGYGGTAISYFAVSSTTPAATYVDLEFNTYVGTLTLQAENPLYWPITTSGDVEVQVTAVEIFSPTVVRLTITEAKGGDSYTITMPLSGLKSVGGDKYNGTETVNFTGVAAVPTVTSVTAIDSRHLRVAFSENVIEEDALDVDNYVITLPDLQVLSIAKETDSVYILTTAPQVPGEEYLLTVSNVRDQSQNPV